MSADAMSNFNGTPVVKTLMLTDFVDSTKFVETYGDMKAASISAVHDRAARDLLRRYGGQEIDKTDGFLFIFDRPIDAVHYALSYNQALLDLSKELGVTLAARTGIHLGEVILRENPPDDVARGAKPVELEGLAKPMVARIMSLALGHQALITQSAFELARRASVGDPHIPQDTQWIEHGPYVLKGIAEPVRIFEVGRVGSAVLEAPPNTSKAHRYVVKRQSKGLIIAAAASVALFVLLLLGGAAAVAFNFVHKSIAKANPVAEAPARAPEPEPSGVGVGVRQRVGVEEKSEVDQGVDSGQGGEEAPPPTVVALRVVTEPEGATIKLGKTKLGLSPATQEVPLKVDDYEIQASLRGHATARATCSVTQEDVARGESVCTVKLKKRGGSSSGDEGGKGGEVKVEGVKPRIHIIPD